MNPRWSEDGGPQAHRQLKGGDKIKHSKDRGGKQKTQMSKQRET